MKFTEEQIELIKQCKTPEELVSKAKDKGLTLSPEQAEKCLNAFSFADLSEDDCDVASGGCDNEFWGPTNDRCPGCGKELTCYEKINSQVKDNNYYCFSCLSDPYDMGSDPYC